MSFRLPFLLPLLFLAGCNIVPTAQPDNTRFFVLTAPKPPAGATSGEGKLRVGLKTVAVAEYLKTPMLTVRSHANEIAYANNARWAEPIEAGIGRILLSSLAASPAVASVIPAPFPFDSERDYDVAIDVLQCEGSTTGRSSARFEAAIVISTPGPNPRVVAQRVFTAPAAAWDGSNYGRLAALLSDDVAALGREIAGMLPNP